MENRTPQDIEPYSISRVFLATMVAGHSSGLWNAVAEQEDLDIADEMLALLEKRLQR